MKCTNNLVVEKNLSEKQFSYSFIILLTWYNVKHSYQPFSLCSLVSSFQMWAGTRKRTLCFFFRCAVLQKRMRSPLFGAQTCVFAWSFHMVSTTCLWPAKALAGRCSCTGLLETLLVAYVISTFFSCVGSFVLWRRQNIQILYVSRIWNMAPLGNKIETDSVWLSLFMSDNEKMYFRSGCNIIGWHAWVSFFRLLISASLVWITVIIIIIILDFCWLTCRYRGNIYISGPPSR